MKHTHPKSLVSSLYPRGSACHPECHPSQVFRGPSIPWLPRTELQSSTQRQLPWEDPGESLSSVPYWTVRLSSAFTFGAACHICPRSFCPSLSSPSDSSQAVRSSYRVLASMKFTLSDFCWAQCQVTMLLCALLFKAPTSLAVSVPLSFTVEVESRSGHGSFSNSQREGVSLLVELLCSHACIYIHIHTDKNKSVHMQGDLWQLVLYAKDQPPWSEKTYSKRKF